MIMYLTAPDPTNLIVANGPDIYNEVKTKLGLLTKFFNPAWQGFFWNQTGYVTFGFLYILKR